MVIDSLAGVLEDLMGCSAKSEPEKTECNAEARKYATYIIYGGGGIIILIILLKAYKMFK